MPRLNVQQGMRGLGVVPVVAGVVLAMAGCASSPSQKAPDGVQDLYARLAKRNETYVVEGICRLGGSSVSKGESQYGSCPYGYERAGRLYFSLATLEPVETHISCKVYNINEKNKSSTCDEFVYADLYSSSAVQKTAAFVGAALKFGTQMSMPQSLDTDLFKRYVESSLPTQQRLKILRDDETYRAGFRARLAEESRQEELARANAKAEDARKRVQFRQSVAEANSTADRSFAALSATQKNVGSTVCSRDNRIGYVEQATGAKIKVLLRGRAVAQRDAVFGRNPLGPFEVDKTGLSFEQVHGPNSGNIELPVIDPNFLFKPHQTVRIAPVAASQIWDESRFWAPCAWRVS
ncbi:hypothetical protein [Hydrocarboniphaga effusa]|uniref:hypothetical protein n=1 Tax=Hydrocarboniphaga effusa TaxID=243629 RepID=UPI003BAB9A18